MPSRHVAYQYNFNLFRSYERYSKESVIIICIKYGKIKVSIYSVCVQKPPLNAHADFSSRA